MQVTVGWTPEVKLEGEGDTLEVSSDGALVLKKVMNTAGGLLVRGG